MTTIEDEELPFDIREEVSHNQLLENEEDQKRLQEHILDAKKKAKKQQGEEKSTINIKDFNKKLDEIRQSFSQVLSTYREIHQSYDDLCIRAAVEKKSEVKMKKVMAEWEAANKNLSNCNNTLQGLYTNLTIANGMLQA